MEGSLPSANPIQVNKESSAYSRQERASDKLGNATTAWQSCTFSRCEYVEDSLFSSAGVGGGSPYRVIMKPPALDNILSDSMYIVHILTWYLSYALLLSGPRMWKCGGGGFWAIMSIYLKTRE